MAEGSTCEKFSEVNGRKQSTCIKPMMAKLKERELRENVRMETDNAFSTTWKTLYTLITVHLFVSSFNGDKKA